MDIKNIINETIYKKIYVGFNLEEVSCMFDCNIKLQLKETILEQLLQKVRFLYFPKKGYKYF